MVVKETLDRKKKQKRNAYLKRYGLLKTSFKVFVAYTDYIKTPVQVYLYNKVALKLLDRYSLNNLSIWCTKHCKLLERSIMLG